MMTSQDLFRQAQERVLASPQLKPYAEVLLADWPEAETHWQWVLTASEDELVAWAQEADVRQEQEDEPGRA
jgi:hypothetical protein